MCWFMLHCFKPTKTIKEKRETHTHTHMYIKNNDNDINNNNNNNKHTDDHFKKNAYLWHCLNLPQHL